MQENNQTQPRPFELDDLQPSRKERLQAKHFMRVLNNKFPTDREQLCILKALKDMIVAKLPLAEEPNDDNEK